MNKQKRHRWDKGYQCKDCGLRRDWYSTSSSYNVSPMGKENTQFMVPYLECNRNIIDEVMRQKLRKSIKELEEEIGMQKVYLILLEEKHG